MKILYEKGKVFTLEEVVGAPEFEAVGVSSVLGSLSCVRTPVLRALPPIFLLPTYVPDNLPHEKQLFDQHSKLLHAQKTRTVSHRVKRRTAVTLQWVFLLNCWGSPGSLAPGISPRCWVKHEKSLQTDFSLLVDLEALRDHQNSDRKVYSWWCVCWSVRPFDVGRNS
jgi:hypothetical protein